MSDEIRLIQCRPAHTCPDMLDVSATRGLTGSHSACAYNHLLLPSSAQNLSSLKARYPHIQSFAARLPFTPFLRVEALRLRVCRQM